MSSSSVYHRGKRVSRAHGIMLAAYEIVRRPIYINQGQRTIPEQAGFFAHFLRYGHPVAARPWGGAPHIKWRAQHHAIDANAPQPVHDLADFYRDNGVHVEFNVRTEGWHMDPLYEQQLITAAKHLAKEHGLTGLDGKPALPSLSRGMTGPSVVRLKKHLYDHGIRDFSSTKDGKLSSNRFNPFFSKATEDAVKRFQKKMHLPTDGDCGPRTWAKLLGPR